jgi:uncharacterized protein (TIRG00374 family)
LLLTRRFWLGFIVTVGLLLLFLWKVDFQQTGRELQNANYTYLVPAVLVYFIALGFRSLRWRYLLLHLKPIPANRLYSVVSIGYLANNILPVRLGELVRSHFVGEKEGISKASALATILVERALDGLTLLFLAAIVWPFLPWTSVLRNESGGLDTPWLALSILVAVIFVVGFAVLFLFATSPRLGRGLARLMGRVSPRGIRPKVESFVHLLIEGLGAFRSPRKLALISLLSLPVWLTEAATYYIVAISFGLDQPFQVILLVTATSNLATAVPSSIGGIGPFEVVAKSTLVAFGVAGEPAAAYSFFVHIMALWLPVNIMGLLFLWRENLSLSQLARSKQIDIPLIPQTEGGVLADYGDGVAGEGEEK